MRRVIVKENYKSLLNLIETEKAIKLVKDTFELELSKQLNLIRVSAPLFVQPETGLNDNLNGYEKAVSFKAIDLENCNLEIVQSLAKWKRNALSVYNFDAEYGLYTDMNAIRPFEELDNIHSLYVDQWDWERIIKKEDRNLDYLKEVVRKIYKALLITEKVVEKAYPILSISLPEDIAFISTTELEAMYPNLTSKEREDAITKKYKAVFIYQIGWPLPSGNPHDGRAADYDDWNLNGDILLWYDELNISLEISSMGIRVDQDSLVKQIKHKKEEYKLETPYAVDVLNNHLPLTIGGGIGQSRMCMFFLKKAHIGEVQASVWPKDEIELMRKNNIHLL